MRKSRSRSNRGRRGAAERESKKPTDELELIDASDDLESLPVLDEALEPEDTSGVTITHDELVGKFEDLVTVVVPEMEKSAVVEAVDGPLRRFVDQHADLLRWKRVLVEFTGDAMIPSAIKDLVADVLGPLKPVVAAVQRGYPNEIVLENEKPTLDVTAIDDDARVRVEITSGDLSIDEVNALLPAALDSLAQNANDRAFDFVFAGDATPDASTRDRIRDALQAAGATRVNLLAAEGEIDILFDRELESRVEVRGSRASAYDTTIEITPFDEEDVTNLSVSLVLGRQPERIADQRLRVQFMTREPHGSELDHLLGCTAKMGASSLTLRGEACDDMILPQMLLAATQGKASSLTILPAGRDQAGFLAAFRREIANMADAVRGRALTIEWPEDFDREPATIDAMVQEVLLPLEPLRITLSTDGETQPLYPMPMVFETQGDGMVCRLDSDAGKPAELVAIAEQVIPSRTDLSGRDVTIDVQGDGTISRTLRRSLLALFEQAGVTRAELHDRGENDVLLPRLLESEELTEDEFRLFTKPAGRTPAQIQRAAARDLEALALPDGVTLHVQCREQADEITDLLVQHGAARIILEADTTVQVHPELFAPPAQDGDAADIYAMPDAADDAALQAQVERELPGLLAALENLGACTVTLNWPDASIPPDGAAGRACDLIVAAGPTALLLDTGAGDPEQLFPEVIPEPEPEIELIEEPEASTASEEIPLLEEPAEETFELPDPVIPAAEPVEVHQPVRVLGRRDGDPGMVLVGIPWCNTPESIDRTSADLQALADETSGKRVLMVFERNGVEIACPDHHGIAQTARKILEPQSAALLVGRASPTMGKHFEVLSSTVDGLAAGSRVRDPRAR